MLLLQSSDIELTELFPSPLLKYFWADSEGLNKKLAKLILSKEKDHQGMQTTNVGGWHSNKELQRWEGPCIKIILDRILALGHEMIRKVTGCTEGPMFSDWKIQAWANVNRQGNYNKFHTHIRNKNLWSGVYYVSLGLENSDGPEPARTVFVDQHQVLSKHSDQYKKRYLVYPKPGLMLLFPSSLGHRVESHTGTGERITVAFNLKNDNFTTVYYEIEQNSKKV